MDNNSIILTAGGVLLGLIIGFIIAKVLEKNKASKLIKDEMSAYLKEMEQVIDDQIEKVDIKSPINEAW